MSSKWKKIVFAGAGVAVTYIGMSVLAKIKIEDKNIDIDNPHLVSATKRDNYRNSKSVTRYEKIVKPAIDKVLSFGGIIVLLPFFAGISLAVFIDDPGPVFFTQKRIGNNKHYMTIHKFRSMRSDTPHNVPTHQLNNPDKYITRVGGFLRRTSLDELPQIWDIFRGKMSFVGPRPALWNQDNLVAERDKYGANNVMPGLTGLAQIRGRDELEILEKARLDGEYTSILRKGGMNAFCQDMKCFLGTFSSVLKHDGVVEGGTGELHKTHNLSVNDVYITSNPPLREGFLTLRCKILIVGAGSYIGTSVERWFSTHDNNYEVDTFNTLAYLPTVKAFTGYDVMLYVVGIAHCKETKENAKLYYEVNRDLAINVAEKAKKAGVKHFIILSTMSVYGMETGEITRDTNPNPKSNYGRSKLEADEKIWGLRDDNFRVAILRPPMVYGNGCKGNYQLLRKLVLNIPVFPKVNNQRSMIYIGNLCSFVQNVIEYQREGIFFPQNAEYVNISEMVGRIAITNGKKVKKLSLFNPFVTHIPLTLFDKVFGSLTYEMTDPICTYNFDDSISLTEIQMV